VLARLDKPALLIYGEHDHFAESPEQFAKEIEGSQVLDIAGGGPFLFYEKPAECADAIIEFAAER
jgi:pimeloyl-ACP methyl ester carboxylesterase